MSHSPVSAAGRSPRIALDLRYSLFTAAYVALVLWLAPHPEPGNASRDSLAQLVTNLYHIPLYAGLGFFVLQTISGGRALAAHGWTRAVVTLGVTAVAAMLDEWHQVYVPGRDPSLSDFLLDQVGVATLLLVCALGTMKGRGS